MSLVRFVAKNHPQQALWHGPKPDVDDRAMDPIVFAALHERFQFSVDAAASRENSLLPRYWTVEDNALIQPWKSERVWCNPPYSNIRPWVEKATAEAARAALIVMILPANRTEQAWWQDLVEPLRDGRVPLGPRVEFLRGRVRFIKPGQRKIGPNERPPFGSCLLIWEGAQK